MYQLQYWTEMQHLKVHSYYLELYQLRCERIEMVISIFLAVTSSASVGAWAVWKDAGILWGAIIALSQVVSVAYKFLPFKSRIKPLGSASVELSVLADDVESGWYGVCEGELTEKEIHTKRTSIRKKKTAIMKSAFSGVSLPENEKLMKLAEKKMTTYFNSYYPEV